VSRRTIFFVSDQTGVTAETMGHSLMTQFEGQEFRPVTLPFVSSVDKAQEAVRRINRAHEEEGVRPIIFSTLVQDELREIVMTANGLFLDFFAAFVGPLENELNTRSTHRAGRAHGIADLAAYTTRINATNFALANDDGTGNDYAHADVILVGVSRSGKTPTCLYMALQYGVFAANYPLTEEDLEAGKLPERLQSYRRKLYALTIAPERLQQIRNERRPESRYSSRAMPFRLSTPRSARSRRSPVASSTPRASSDACVLEFFPFPHHGPVPWHVSCVGSHLPAATKKHDANGLRVRLCEL
jgi:[pyruvate, water dikinase]-phosphate phosphotransferase / [pyruvate, water dikinase] kinase